MESSYCHAARWHTCTQSSGVSSANTATSATSRRSCWRQCRSQMRTQTSTPSATPPLPRLTRHRTCECCSVGRACPPTPTYGSSPGRRNVWLVDMPCVSVEMVTELPDSCAAGLSTRRTRSGASSSRARCGMWRVSGRAQQAETQTGGVGVERVPSHANLYVVGQFFYLHEGSRIDAA